MAVTPGNIIQGPGEIWIGAFGATEPAADTAGLAADPGAGWTSLGGTDGPVSMSVAKTYADVMVEQLPMPVSKRVTEMRIKVIAQLAEATLENLAYALNETAPTTATQVKTFNGANAIDLGCKTTESAIIIDGPNADPACGNRRMIVRKVVQIADVSSDYGKAGKALIPVEFDALYVSSSIAPYVILEDDPA